MDMPYDFEKVMIIQPGKGTFERELQEARDLAKQMDTDSQFRAGESLWRLAWHMPDLKTEAMTCFERAASQSHVKAQGLLGAIYARNPRTYKVALDWYTRAADSGDKDALCGLAIVWDEGVLIDKDRTKAVQLFARSAELGSAYAQSKLAEAYLYGDGVEQDWATAYMWALLACQDGDYWRRHIESGAAPDIVRVGTERYKDWMANH
jgi:TPR repeat protein